MKLYNCIHCSEVNNVEIIVFENNTSLQSKIIEVSYLDKYSIIMSVGIRRCGICGRELVDEKLDKERLLKIRKLQTLI